MSFYIYEKFVWVLRNIKFVLEVHQTTLKIKSKYTAMECSVCQTIISLCHSEAQFGLFFVASKCD